MQINLWKEVLQGKVLALGIILFFSIPHARPVRVPENIPHWYHILISHIFCLPTYTSFPVQASIQDRRYSPLSSFGGYTRLRLQWTSPPRGHLASWYSMRMRQYTMWSISFVRTAGSRRMESCVPNALITQYTFNWYIFKDARWKVVLGHLQFSHGLLLALPSVSGVAVEVQILI